jgi:hypothetical protein
MKIYKDDKNDVYFYLADGSQDHLIGDKTPISKEEADLLAEARFAPARENLLKTLTYAQLREMHYPPIGDQLDAFWKGGAEAEAMKAKIDAVKAKYPKS